MRSEDSAKFLDSLRADDLGGLISIPKSDLHNHAGRGGNLRTLSAWWGVEITPPNAPLGSLNAMNDWFQKNVKVHRPGHPGYLSRLKAAFFQAERDGVRLLALSFDPSEVDALGGPDGFGEETERMRAAFAPHVDFLPELSFDRSCDPGWAYERAEEILPRGIFFSIDLACDERARPARQFRRLYELAGSLNVLRIAHVGELGSAADVVDACESLSLDEVHHGIAAASSTSALNFLRESGIRLNVCPASNIMIGRAASYRAHPIRTLFEAGVAVTVNTDDQLIFGASASEEYLNLYRAGTLDAEALDLIRLTGLARKGDSE